MNEAVEQDALADTGCPLCHLAEGRIGFYAARDNWKYYQCRRCGATFLAPLPDANALRTYYNQTYSVPMERYVRSMERKALPILAELQRRIPGHGKLLEIGCSYGCFLEKARRSGWDVSGIEIDSRASNYGREKFGLNILCGDLESEFHRLEPPYDAIVTFHVLEHVVEPMRFLNLCRELLRPDGVLLLKTPNVASWVAKQTKGHWGWLSPPAHIHLFTPAALRRALERAGLRVEGIETRRGDSGNTLFELTYAVARVLKATRNGTSEPQRGSTPLLSWKRDTVRYITELIYYPVGLVLDPWLAKKGLQPELVAIACASAGATQK
jgi:2-polyprenyl-3-methyl-5-hydroxy-6-metoxy-1,4-benzoquinol methylase